MRSMREHLRQHGVGYLVAAGTTAAALLLQFALLPWPSHDAPVLLFVMAVVATAWYGGMPPGLLATGLSFLACDYFFIRPTGSLFIADTSERIRMVLFLLVGVTVSVFNQYRLVARRRMASRHRELEQEITDERQARTAVRESEEHLRLALDAARMVTWDWNLTTGVVHRSENAARIFGLQSGEAEAFYRLAHPDDRARVEAIIAEARQGHCSPFELEFRIVTAEGRTLWVVDKGSLRTDPITRQVHLTGVCMDITGRKQAEEQLRHSEQQLADFFENATVGVHWVGPDGTILRANRAELDLLGYSPEEYLGHHIAEFHVDKDAIDDILRRLQAGEELHDYEARMRCKNGSIRHVLINSNVLWEDGEFVHTRCFTRDTTERKQAEERLRKKNERLHLLSEAAEVLLHADNPDAMLRSLFARIAPHLGLDTYFNFMLSEAGDALRLASCVGIPDETARSIERLEFGQAICGTVALHRQPIVATHIQQSDDPKAELVKSFGIRAYACNPLMVGDTLLGTLSFASRSRDQFDADELDFLQTISHYVTVAYERVRLIQSLRAADRHKDEFLATLAHELRNPLAPIRNALELMRRADSEPALREQARALMERQLQRMVRLIDDLLEISRISSGKVRIRKEQVELAAVVRSSVEAARPFIEAQGHELTVTLPSEPVYLDADPARLAQVFANLLDNAAKYTEQQGHIWLTAEREGGEVIVSVRDTGIGLAAEHLPRIFEMFSQVAPALERSQGGLGVGLSLVKGLVELHDGTIEARSGGIGRGSEFRVRLPVIKAPMLPPEEPSSDGEKVASPCKLRILVVDDNRDAANSAALMLRVMGHNTEKAYDGLEAVEAAARFRPDVVLLDIGMPRMNGYEAARQIREQPWGKKMVLIAMTGWGQEEDKRRALLAGCDHHLTKPVDPAALEKLLAVLTVQNKA